ncbi:MAG TPA: ATP-binding protein [Solirubrobacteraceae bacterium]|nr:ATP-binding protein [Solirubrobacteraceae bacterium]
MAATGSDRRFRLTLRLRLTLLYGACFLVAGVALLGITYALVAHDTGAQAEQFTIRGPSFIAQFGSKGGPSVTKGGTSGGAGGAIAIKAKTQIPPPLSSTLRKQLRELQTSGQRLINRTAARANGELKAQRSRSLSSLLTWSGIALAVMALISIFLGWLLAGRALRPVRTMSTRARAITEESLHERLGIEGRDDELGDLARSFDELLARLERAFESQRRFVANASHELRTPITLERTLVELALSDPDASTESLRHVCERVLASTEQQERVIEALLTLARSQAGIESEQDVDLAEVVAEMLLARESRLAGINVVSQLGSAPVKGDPALLERLVANLIDNATVHNSGVDPWIHIRTGQREGRPSLVIANSGPEIPGERVRELFEPFRRLDDERTADAPGLGLGLSIVQAIATAHGAEVRARSLADGGLELEVGFGAVGAPVYPPEQDGTHQRVLAGTDRTA